VALKSRLNLLRRIGLRQDQRILDYGCGSGLFVRLLNEQGYNAIGYDAYSPDYSDKAPLSQHFDALVSQDVIEHVPDPLQTIREWVGLLKQGGLLCIGTPNAEDIDLQRPDRFSLEIHQPFHRHILSQAALLEVCANEGMKPVGCINRFYSDTRFPLNNLAFARAYVERKGGFLDVLFEEPDFSILLSPGPLWLAFFGGVIPSRGNMLCAFEKT
jgi:SAM-dependent methyltransferase